MKLLSVCIPTYEMHGKGVEYLRHSFEKLARQTFTDFNVIISDHSADNAIRSLCEDYGDRLDIVYVRNEEHRGNSPANTNNAMRHADGRLIKILFQDDFLASDTALAETVAEFDLNTDRWLVSASLQTRDGISLFRPIHPRYHHKIHLGPNTISSPSVLTVLNEDLLFFDEHLVWSMDTDYYRRCFERYGLPKILSTATVVNRAGDHQISSGVSASLKEKERQYILRKYGEKELPGSRHARQVVALWKRVHYGIRNRIRNHS